MKRLGTILLLLLLVPLGWAQSGAVPKVLIPIIAKDSHNRLAVGFTAESFVIRERKTQVADFSLLHATDLPLKLGILIDTSRSQSSTSLPEALTAAREFVNNTIRAGDDRVFFLTFSDKSAASGWLKKEDLAGASIQVAVKGATALYDSIAIACRERMGQPDWQMPSRRVLVLISDGKDDASKMTLPQAESEALKSGTVIFTVSTQEAPMYPPRRSEKILGQMASITGGESFTGLSRTDMPKVFAKIKELMDGMYYARYVPPSSTDYVHEVEIKPSSKQKFDVLYPIKYAWFQ
jgi:VWFA-related protein